jgi:hypothetical protein
LFDSITVDEFETGCEVDRILVAQQLTHAESPRPRGLMESVRASNRLPDVKVCDVPGVE